MKNLIPVTVAVLGMAVSSLAFAGTTTATAPATAKPAAAESAHKEKHSACVKEAKEKHLKGEAEKKFVKECMEGKSEEKPAEKK